MRKPITHLFIELGGGTPDVHHHPISIELRPLESPKRSNAQTEQMGNPGEHGAPTKDRSASRLKTGWQELIGSAWRYITPGGLISAFIFLALFMLAMHGAIYLRHIQDWIQNR